MSRSIQTGDYVTISLKGKGESQLYSVETISPEGIYVSSIADVNQKILLVSKNGKWNVSGTPIIYDLEFKSKDDIPQLLFTNIPDVDIQILTNLDDKTLGLVCQLSTYAKSLCQNEELWKKKTEIFLRSHYNPPEKYPEINWKYYYRGIKGYFNRLWIVSDKYCDETGVLSINKTQEGAIDYIIEYLKSEKEYELNEKEEMIFTDVDGIKSASNELKEKIFDDEGYETTNNFYKISFYPISNIKP